MQKKYQGPWELMLLRANIKETALHSLVSKPEWNGWIGKVRGFDESARRYVVVIASDLQNLEAALKASSDLSVKKFKPENLRKIHVVGLA